MRQRATMAKREARGERAEELCEWEDLESQSSKVRGRSGDGEMEGGEGRWEGLNGLRSQSGDETSPRAQQADTKREFESENG